MDPLQTEGDENLPLAEEVQASGADSGAGAGSPPGETNAQPPVSAPMSDPDGGIEFAGSAAPEYEEGTDPNEKPAADFDFTEEGESNGDAVEPAKAKAEAEAKVQQETAPSGPTEEDIAFVQAMERVLTASPFPPVPADAPGAQANNAGGEAEEAPVQLTEEEAEQLLLDPSKLNDVFARIQEQSVKIAMNRLARHQEQGRVAQFQQEVNAQAQKFYQDNPHLDTDELKVKCAQVAQTLYKVKPGLAPADLFAYTAKFVTARMKTHPHEFAANMPDGLPPLPGTKQAAPAQPTAPAKPRPAFAGGGVATRRTAPKTGSGDAVQDELNALRPEHVW